MPPEKSSKPLHKAFLRFQKCDISSNWGEDFSEKSLVKNTVRKSEIVPTVTLAIAP